MNAAGSKSGWLACGGGIWDQSSSFTASVKNNKEKSITEPCPMREPRSTSSFSDSFGFKGLQMLQCTELNHQGIHNCLKWLTFSSGAMRKQRLLIAPPGRRGVKTVEAFSSNEGSCASTESWAPTVHYIFLWVAIERWRRTVDKCQTCRRLRWLKFSESCEKTRMCLVVGGEKKGISRLHTFILPLLLKSYVHLRNNLGCFVDSFWVHYHILSTQTFCLMVP